MATLKKPTAVDIVTAMIQRRDLARDNVGRFEAEGKLGQVVYWRTIALDAAMLAAWVAADDQWLSAAKEDKLALEGFVKALDNPTNNGKLPEPVKLRHNGAGRLCGGSSTIAPCPACDRDLKAAGR